MALTVANIDSFSDDTWGRHRIKNVKVTFDSSYATGGESFTPADVGMASFSNVLISDADGFTVQYDYTNQKLKVFESGTASAALDEQDAATDLSTLIVRITCIGH